MAGVKDDATSTEFSRRFEMEDVGERGLETVIEATADERIAIAARLGIVSVNQLSSTINLRPWNGNGIYARGTLRANVTQTCGVTLEPVDEAIEENFEMEFLPEERLSPDVIRTCEENGQEIPEPIVNGVIDFGELVTQFLAVSMNPYPRKPGVSVEDVLSKMAATGNYPAARDVGSAGSKPGPFSALQHLKNRLN